MTELEKKYTKERLEEFVNEADTYYGFTYESVGVAVEKAFELGKNKAKKKVKDNPYNIDYERQTVLDL